MHSSWWTPVTSIGASRLKPTSGGFGLSFLHRLAEGVGLPPGPCPGGSRSDRLLERTRRQRDRGWYFRSPSSTIRRPRAARPPRPPASIAGLTRSSGNGADRGEGGSRPAGAVTIRCSNSWKAGGQLNNPRSFAGRARAGRSWAVADPQSASNVYRNRTSCGPCGRGGSCWLRTRGISSGQVHFGSDTWGGPGSGAPRGPCWRSWRWLAVDVAHGRGFQMG